MNRVLYFCPNGIIYETCAYTRADIAQLVRDHTLESLASADRQFDFWFTPSTRHYHRVANRTATEMLLATTQFTARTVPLLRGGIVVASHDRKGELDGLSSKQLGLLAQRNRSLTRPEHWVLGRRIARERRDEQRRLAAREATGSAQGHKPTARH
jgi:hypothetical protein